MKFNNYAKSGCVTKHSTVFLVTCLALCAFVGLASPSYAIWDIPSTPNLTSVVTPGCGELTLTWTAGAGPYSGFYVFRSTVSGGPYTQVGSVVGTTFTDFGLTNGQTYYYVVQAWFGYSYAVGNYSNEMSGVPHCHHIGPPPWWVIGIAQISLSNAVFLHWPVVTTDTSGNALVGRATYNVYEGTSFGPAGATGSNGTSWSLVASGLRQNSFPLVGLTNGVTYTFAVTASTRANGEGGISSPVTATPQATTEADFIQIDRSSGGEWPADPFGYGTDGYTIIGGTASAPAYAAIPAISGTVHNYKSPLETIGDGALATAPGGTAAADSVIDARERVTVDVTVTGSTPKVVALYLFDYAGRGRVETVEAFDGGRRLGTRVVTDFSYPGAYVTYRVLGHVLFKITRVAGPNAVLSGVLFGTSMTAPASASVLKATPGTAPGTIGLFWTPSLGATGYRLYRRVIGPPNALPEPIVQLPAAVNSYTDSGLVDGVAYSYFVVPENLAGPGPQSNLVQIDFSAADVITSTTPG